MKSNNNALLIVDMVYDFTNPNGLVFYPENQIVLPVIRKVEDFCRNRGDLIIFAQHCYRANKFDQNLLSMRPNCMEGSGGEAIDPMLYVDEKKDYVIKKRRYSAFFGTDLDLILREHHIDNLVIVGTKTNCCIRASVTDAYYLNYKVTVLSDCVATNSDLVNKVHLDDIHRYLGRVCTSQEFMSEQE